MAAAVKKVINENASVRTVAKESGINRMTSKRYIARFRNNDGIERTEGPVGYWLLLLQARQVQRNQLRRNESCGLASASDDDNPPCLYCDELFLNSVKEFRAWIQCQCNCKKWCHRVCAGNGKGDIYFVCEFCFAAWIRNIHNLPKLMDKTTIKS